jgi:hypothetical protein
MNDSLAPAAVNRSHKSHLAIALGLEAAKRRLHVAFVRHFFAGGPVTALLTSFFSFGDS